MDREGGRERGNGSGPDQVPEEIDAPAIKHHNLCTGLKAGVQTLPLTLGHLPPPSLMFHFLLVEARFLV